ALDVGDVWHVAQHVLAGGEQRGGEELEHRVLGAADADGARQRTAGPDSDGGHRAQYGRLPPCPGSSSSTPPRPAPTSAGSVTTPSCASGVTATTGSSPTRGRSAAT